MFDNAAKEYFKKYGFQRRTARRAVSWRTRRLSEHGLENQAIEIVASALMTDTLSAYKGDAMDIVGYGMSRKCADKVFEEANASRDDVGVLVTYDALRLCPMAAQLICKGHPLGATGLGMHFYITMQLRNWAGPMQAPGLFPLVIPAASMGWPSFGGRVGGWKGQVGYNHACVCRGVTREDVDKVKSRRSASEYVLQAAKL
ncbi:hypothetical protein CPB85DRAFT_1335219 [Mucidula mucida]|nr:hypothetical protein CPB85DRAFT_1335219 [Mucidula mucida]